MFVLRLFTLGPTFRNGYLRQHIVGAVNVTVSGHTFRFAHSINKSINHKSGHFSNAFRNSDFEGVQEVPNVGEEHGDGTEVRRLKGNVCEVKDEEHEGEGVHIPVMVNEVLMALAPQPGEVRHACQVMLDFTFGCGGHSRALLQQEPTMRLVAMDRDPEAYKRACLLARKYPGRVFPILGRFSDAWELLQKHGLSNGITGVLVDAGPSTDQLTDPARGFGLSCDGPLDMRMDGKKAAVSAADVVNCLQPEALSALLSAYGEDWRANRIARAIYAARPIVSTIHLACVVENAYPAGTISRDRLNRKAHVATRAFQAIRAFVNNEPSELLAALEVSGRLLQPGGRLAVIAFHSIEDRIVKRFLQGVPQDSPIGLGARAHIRGRRGLQDLEESKEAKNLTVQEAAKWQIMSKKVVKASFEEVERNPCARSAKLRAAIRV
uniref:12S rRNA N4-methylcytidine methyltransferase-like isoform X1 n=1 Tax=Myxine glutinosa TaxID=7769 RepID=UPI00358E3F09